MPLPLLTLLLTAQALTPPPSVAPALTAQASGVQIYRCTRQADTFQWSFQSPEATLTDPTTRRQLATHSAGPTWTWVDGSAITGIVLTRAPSPDPASIPWLLLAAHTAGPTPGVLTDITRIRRFDTHGGNPPLTPCDAAHADTLARIPTPPPTPSTAEVAVLPGAGRR